MEDHSIGRLYSDNATLSFAYNPEYLDGQNASKLSASLPLTDTVFDHQVTSAFSPDSFRMEMCIITTVSRGHRGNSKVR